MRERGRRVRCVCSGRELSELIEKVEDRKLCGGRRSSGEGSLKLEEVGVASVEEEARDEGAEG